MKRQIFKGFVCFDSPHPQRKGGKLCYENLRKDTFEHRLADFSLGVRQSLGPRFSEGSLDIGGFSQVDDGRLSLGGPY